MSALDLRRLPSGRWCLVAVPDPEPEPSRRRRPLLPRLRAPRLAGPAEILLGPLPAAGGVR